MIYIYNIIRNGKKDGRNNDTSYDEDNDDDDGKKQLQRQQ